MAPHTRARPVLAGAKDDRTVETDSHDVGTLTPVSDELQPSATYMPGAGDYFGGSWTATSPRRSELRQTEHAGYSQNPARNNRIHPGAKNSFAMEASENHNVDMSPSRRQHYQAGQNPRTPYEHQKPAHRTRDAANSRFTPADVSPDRPGPSSPGLAAKRRRAPSQKVMLSKALQKANHAVVLDNAQNIEGAMDAYKDACDLLQQVMVRSSGEEDRAKLEKIRNTYENRVRELQSSEGSRKKIHDKALPHVPVTADDREEEPFSPLTDDEDDIPQGRLYKEAVKRDDGIPSNPAPHLTLTREQLPPRRQSLMPLSAGEESSSLSVEGSGKGRMLPQQGQSEHTKRATHNKEQPARQATERQDHKPTTLSPRRTANAHAIELVSHKSDDSNLAEQGVSSNAHLRHATAESTSWLDTIDESGGSSGSSIHSRVSSIGGRKGRVRANSGDTEAEFDAALDAAVEAAYDEGYEPMSDDEEAVKTDPAHTTDSSDYISNVRKNIDVAKQRVREAEREAAIVNARETENRRRLGPLSASSGTIGTMNESQDGKAENEQQIFDGTTRDSTLEGVQVKAGFGDHGPAEHSSASAPRAPRATNPALRQITPLQPPFGTLPPPPKTDPSDLTSSQSTTVQGNLQPPGVRDRRLSGQKARQLKIETHPRGNVTNESTKQNSTHQTRSSRDVPAPKTSSQAILQPPFRYESVADSTQKLPKEHEGSTPKMSTTKPPLTSDRATESLPDDAHRPLGSVDSTTITSSPAKSSSKVHTADVLKKNYSSSSLRSLKQPAVTPPAVEDTPGTPLSRVFSITSTLPLHGSAPGIPDLPTPSVANFARHGLPIGSMSFFDNDIHSPFVPGSPNPLNANAPVPLEPCPESFLLRPFWLMRAVYQSITHPRGGYISTRLFVPRDIWRVKNVKLKNVDEKVSNCDLLTAALMNLSKVDTFDADAVLEEMQALELILDQVQTQLTKKLGGDVGVSGFTASYRPPLNADESGATFDAINTKTGSSAGKSYLTSWRKLRSKASNGPAYHPPAGSNLTKEASKEPPSMRSVPMTTLMNPRFARRDPTKILGIGPHAQYMAALARLCDAAQILDQVARQVEDPGLRHSSQTHVGLELCTRHAAEFFAFFICRFALSDIGLMLDKFIKRGSEWVLA